MTGAFRCCKHCVEDPVHDVEKDHHEVACWSCKDEIKYTYTGRPYGKTAIAREVTRLHELAQTNFDLYHEAMTSLRSAREERDVVGLNLEMIRDEIRRLIDDLDKARADGTIYTYGNVQERLREMMKGDSDA